MLKLVKYNFVQSMRTYLMSFGIFLIVSSVLVFILWTQNILSIILAMHDNFPSGFSNDITIIFVEEFLQTGVVLTLFIATFIYYYETMFKKTGYLTMTLPFSSLELLISKVLTMMIWILVGLIVWIFAVSICTFMNQWYLYHLNSFYVPVILERIVAIMKDIFSVNAEAPIIVQIVLYIVHFILMSIFYIAVVSFSLTIVHTKWIRHHRILLTIIVLLISMVVLENIIGPLYYLLSYQYAGNIIPSQRELLYCMTSLFLIALSVYMMNKHIEIE